jgi:hypothetical protein
MKSIADTLAKPNLYLPSIVFRLLAVTVWANSRKIRRTMSTIENMIPAFIPLVVPKVASKYCIDTRELITEVEKAASETRLLIICGGYAGREIRLFIFVPFETVRSKKLTCSPRAKVLLKAY